MNDISEFINRTAKSWEVSYEKANLILNYQTHKKCLRINTLKANKNILHNIKKMGISIKPIIWASNCYEITNGYDTIKKSNLTNDGSIILQNSSSFIPVIALNPQAKDTILDLCAAPGGKTSHIASLTSNKSNILANDSSKARYFKMKKLLNTLGVKANCTLYDGRNINKYLNNKVIDKVLLDAPCSGEANINTIDPLKFKNWNLSKIKRLSRLQTKLLLTSYDLVKPGGTIVYSTCTIAPEENEIVINNLLKKRGAIIEPINLPIKQKSNSVLRWNEKNLDPSIKNTLRVMPTTSNEAFFIALIKKPNTKFNDEFEYNL